MTQDLHRSRSPLLPDRRATPDFFVCDILDAAPKGDMASMEHPIFSLSTKPDLRTRRYEHGSVFIENAPSAQGLATVHDRDTLIYCISQLMAMGSIMALWGHPTIAHRLSAGWNQLVCGQSWN